MEQSHYCTNIAVSFYVTQSHVKDKELRKVVDITMYEKLMLNFKTI